MITLTITLPDGTSASIGDSDTWTSDNADLAALLNGRREDAAEYLPHPFLNVAKSVASELGAELAIDGEDDSEEGVVY